MKVLLFQSRFAPKVAAGEKCQTIRPARKVPICPGDLLSLREWTGKPYRSKQRILRSARCTSVTSIAIDESAIVVNGRALDALERFALSVQDGFDNAVYMRDWFRATHGLPFKGVLICWPTEK